MAFNGTKNLPGKKMIEYLERNGVKFGADLNAYTSYDETCYNLDNVPTANPATIDTALLILHDWSSAINLADKEIDKEFGSTFHDRVCLGQKIFISRIQITIP